MFKKLLTISLSLLINGFFLVTASYGADVTLAWDANATAPDGYRLYYSTTNDSFSQHVEVGYATTEATVTGLDEDTKYYFTVRAFTADGESTNSNVVSWQYTPPDATAPTITVSGPAQTLESTITLGGTAGDNEDVVAVTWSNDRGGSGTAQGTTSWTAADIALAEGVNTITFTASDAAGNQGTASIQVTRTLPDTLAPAVTVSGPSETTGSPISLSGTASDNDSVTSVTWVNDRGGSGTAQGTEAWTAAGIALAEGINTITVSAGDPSGNIGTASIQVTYTVPDTQAPTVEVSGPSQTTEASITLSGTATDNQAIDAVQWANDRGGSGTAQGTASWTASNINLVEGTNTITITAVDTAGNTGTASIQVNRTMIDTTPPAPPVGIRISTAK